MLLNIIEKLFPFEKEVTIEEKINFFSLKVVCKKTPEFTEVNLREVISIIKPNDKFSILTQVEQNDIVSITNHDEIDEFITNYNDSIEFFEENETFSLKLKIDKTAADSKRTIYSYKHFVIFWRQIDPINLLNVLNDILSNYGTVEFETIEPGVEPVTSSRITLNSSLPAIPKRDKIDKFRENCHFGNSGTYALTPEVFHLFNTNNKELTLKFNILCSLFSMVFLFDISSIHDQEFTYKINGYKAINGKVRINEHLASCKSVYYEIYSWVYSTEGNIADKLGLVRNLISIHYDQEITNLDAGILVSIKSAYKTYLKENISKYLDIRSKILQDLDWVSQKSSEIVEKYLSNYQKSIITFLSFFISVFLLRVLSSGEFTNVFTKDATILSFGFLAISVFYLAFSSWTLKSEKQRLKRKYENIKGRFKDLLVEEDIKNILNEDEEFEYELSFIKGRYRRYLWLWIITILILFVAILTVSSHFNWRIIYEFIKLN